MYNHHAYLAGFLDGEGNIHFLSRGRNIRITMSVYNTDIRPLYEFKRAYGGRLGINRVGGGKRKTCYVWQSRAKVAVDAIRKMLPYLLIKRDKAIKAIAIQSENENHPKFRPWQKERKW